MPDRRGFVASLLALVLGWKVQRRPPGLPTSATLALKMAEEPVRVSDLAKPPPWTDTPWSQQSVQVPEPPEALRRLTFHGPNGESETWQWEQDPGGSEGTYKEVQE